MLDIYGTRDEIKLLMKILQFGVDNFPRNRVDFQINNNKPVEINCVYHFTNSKNSECVDGVDGEYNSFSQSVSVDKKKKSFDIGLLTRSEVEDIFFENFCK